MLEKMLCRPMATLMSPATLSLPDMNAIIGSRLPSASATKSSLSTLIVQSASVSLSTWTSVPWA